MGYDPCRKCGELRKVGDYMTPDAEHVCACPKCGDPEYTVPYRRAPMPDDSVRRFANAGGYSDVAEVARAYGENSPEEYEAALPWLARELLAAREALRAFISRQDRVEWKQDGWAKEPECRVCLYCFGKGPWEGPLAHYDDCAFVTARACLPEFNK